MTEKILIVATGNPGKLKEMQAYLEDLEIELQLKPQDLEIEETGKTFVENAALKASQVALATGEWAIADDSGLAVEVLNGEPDSIQPVMLLRKLNVLCGCSRNLEITLTVMLNLFVQWRSPVPMVPLP